MTKPDRIVMLGQHDAASENADDALLLPASMELEPSTDEASSSWLEQETQAPADEDLADDEPVRRDFGWVFPVLGAGFVGIWTAYFIWAHRHLATELATAATWVTLLDNWAPPVLLLLAVFLLMSRSSYRESHRFAEVAVSLSTESARLERRLTSVNRELSLARNFLESQTRDLETLSRLAVDRLSQQAEQLQSLVQINSEKVESLGAVSGAALENLEKLRGQLPVITTSARDVTNNIGNAGRTAHGHLQDLILGFRRLNEFGQASERQVLSLREMVNETLSGFTEQGEQLEATAKRSVATLSAAKSDFGNALENDEAAFAARLKASSEALQAEFDRLRQTIASQEEEAASNFSARVTALDEHVRQVGDSQRDISGQLLFTSQEIERQESAAGDRLQQMGDLLAKFQQQASALAAEGDAITARMAAGLVSIDGKIAESSASLGSTEIKISEMTDASVRLLELLIASAEQSGKALPIALSQGTSQLEAIEQRVFAMRDAAKDVGVESASLNGDVEGILRSISAAAAEIDRLQTVSSQHSAGSMTDLEALRARLAEIEHVHDRLAEATRKTVSEIDEMGEKAATRFASRIASATESAMSTVTQQRAQALTLEFETAADRAMDVSREAAGLLRDQLAKVSELSGNLEQRVAQARERAEETIDNDFARRVALITETLNSNAIDIARALDSEVADTAWAAYLKGDRGIFARRTVSLLNNAENKSIAQLFDSDREFHDHVSRYIHDFEFMLRQVLSTREGNALGVTLLSSDMGKIYVVLAQAIERLRT